LLILVAGAVGCGSDGGPTGVPEGPAPAVVASGLAPDSTAPGGEAQFSVTARPRDGTRLTRFDVHFSGVIEDTLHLPVEGDGEIGFLITLTLPRLPLEGRLGIQAVAAVGAAVGESDTLFLRVADRTPPSVGVDMSGVWSTGVEPGDSVTVQFLARDNAGVEVVSITVSGVTQVSKSFQFPYPDQASGAFRFLVPGTARLGDSAIVQTIAIDMVNQRDTVLTAVRLVDGRGPDLIASLQSPRPTRPFGYPLFLVGDTLRLTVTAQDARGVAWIGFALDDPPIRDSVPGTGLRDSAVFEVTLAPTADRQLSGVYAFAYDTIGNLGAGYQSVSLFAGTERPARVLDSPDFATAVYDWKRDRFYVVEGSSAIAIVPRATFTRQGALTVPGLPFGLDLSESGDSLLVTLPAATALGVFDLRLDPPAFSTIPLTGLGFRWPGALAVGAGGRSLLALLLQPGTADSAAYLLALGSGAQRRLAGVPRPGPVVRSFDRSLVLMTGPDVTVVYRPGADSVELRSALGEASVDSLGTRILAGSVLYDGAFAPVGQVQLSGPAAISVDGTSIHVGSGLPFAWYGLATIRASDGALVDRVFTPVGVTRVFPISGSRAVLIYGGGRLAIIEGP
jgi:hypothetical protein